VAGHVAFVLHAHLPYVRHPEYDRSLEERWLHEAVWESYLPLVDMLDRLAREGIHAPITVSISPPLAAMLGDRLLRRRFEDHLERLVCLASTLRSGRLVDDRGQRVLQFYETRLAWTRGIWERCGGDLVGALVAHAKDGAVEILTSTATHAYLPGLLSSPASIRAQLRLGIRSFEKLSGLRPRGLWLPECAYDPRLGGDLAASGVRYTVLDAHGIELAWPAPPFGIYAPVLSPCGVAFFARDPNAAREVWSRQTGFPGDAVYREFYRDVGFDLPASALAGEVGPDGTRVMTGLKLHRVTGPGPHKEPYDPQLAAMRAGEHARAFIAGREQAARRASAHCKHPILVAPFDAELFGHWWFEGPQFLEHALRALDATAKRGGLSATTLGSFLERFPDAVVSEPAASSWGEGGFGDVWAGPQAARLWRHVHHAEQRTRTAVDQRRNAGGDAGRALDQTIRELMLLEASDWAFMLRRGEMTSYAESRVRAHAHRAARLASIAMADVATPDDVAWLSSVCDKDRLFSELAGNEIRDAFDPWGA
jgi:1,4-alpha-glucan branching enzyme